MKKELIKLMESKIAAIAKMNVEVAVLGKKDKQIVISIVIDGNQAETTLAADRISKLAGEKFNNGGYDAELEAYFCGINL